MRVSMKFLMAVALALPAGAIALPGAGAAGGTTCSHTNGVATFKPPLPKSGSNTTVKPKVIVKHAHIKGCIGGGVASGVFNSTSQFHDATNCDKLLSGAPSTHPPTGTITTTWNTGETGTASITLNQVSGQPTETHVTGVVTSGKFKGKHVDQTLSFAPKTGDCVTADLSQVTFKEVTKLKIS
jgi:hypothetical protein